MTQSTCSADSALSDMCLANRQVFPAKYRPNGRVGKFLPPGEKKRFFPQKTVLEKKFLPAKKRVFSTSCTAKNHKQNYFSN